MTASIAKQRVMSRKLSFVDLAKSLYLNQQYQKMVQLVSCAGFELAIGG